MSPRPTVRHPQGILGGRSLGFRSCGISCAGWDIMKVGVLVGYPEAWHAAPLRLVPSVVDTAADL